MRLPPQYLNLCVTAMQKLSTDAVRCVVAFFTGKKLAQGGKLQLAIDGIGAGVVGAVEFGRLRK